ncbi:iron complex outermembrane recepter protein [Sphingomonas sp. YR710]|uniref:TonB-dependent receptor n=1 Tax=Sphingomonas sp. YR710 TaxID=1882773 RepID=UPI00088A8D21|nr:TonB-dependent receptor [Sphingomonas sp. YR710]SDC97725.1 iron complex outermembrane recepter protein [Sphingomonas sp. YR710]
MKIGFRSLAAATAAVSSLCAVDQSLAADAVSQRPTASDANDIIVSARRIEERLQDVPISVSVISGGDLAKLNIVNSDDLAKHVPGLTTNQRYTPESSTFAIRGFTQELRTSAAVGTYFADVVAPRGGGSGISGGDGAGPAYMFDLQNVQVLKGPQGTLFGRNTTGGAVLLVPKKPTDKLEGYLEGSYGNYRMFRIQGVLNIPLNSWARLRVGVDRMSRTGYVRNLAATGPRTYADVSYVAARASLLLNLAPNVENYTIGTYMRSNHSPVGYQVFDYNQNVGLGILAKPQVDRLNAPGADPYSTELALPSAYAKTRQWQIINSLSWYVSDSLRIKNITSYSRFNQKLRVSIFGGNFVSPYSFAGLPPAQAGGLAFAYPSIPNTTVYTSGAYTAAGDNQNNQSNFTNELQFQGTSAGGKLNWQGGLYYEKSSPIGFSTTTGIATGTLCSITPYETADDLRCRSANPAKLNTINLSTTQVKFINMAAYAQATYALTEQLKLTAGLRYTYDRSSGLAIAKLRQFPFTLSPTALFQANPAICEGGFTGDCSLAGKTSSRRATWTINTAYTPLQDVMVYATWSRGYRQGAANPAAAPQFNTFAPETVDAFEGGLKSSFKGAISGRFNLAGYYNSLRNQQLQYALVPADPNTSNRTSIINAGKSRIYGFEADALINLAEYFHVTGAISYLNTKLVSATVPVITGITVVPTAVQGGELAYSPKWSGSLGATFKLPVPESAGKVELDATYRFQSSYQVAAPTITSLRATAVRQLDLNLDWNSVGSRPIDLSLFATNVTNQFTVVTVNGLRDILGFDARQLGEPRMYGARLRVRFGEGISN